MKRAAAYDIDERTFEDKERQQPQDTEQANPDAPHMAGRKYAPHQSGSTVSPDQARHNQQQTHHAST